MTEHLIATLNQTASRYGDQPAMRHKRNGEWVAWTWSQYRDQVMAVGRGLIDLGVPNGGGVAIQGYNRPEWFLAQLGAIAAGGVPAGIYTTSTPDQVRYIVKHAEALVAIVENVDYLGPFLDESAELEALVAIVLMEGDHPDPRVHSWEQLVERGGQSAADELENRMAALTPNTLCSLIYTSGTTGPPKAVMLNHANALWVADRLLETYDVGAGDSVISYLPLNHIAEQVVSLYGPLRAGACTWFAESLDKVGENLREVRPHIFLAVPRVWEKIQAKIEEAGSRNSALKKKIAAWARRQGLAGGYAEQRGQRRPALYGLADRLVFSKVRQRLGLDRARACVTSTAPISVHTLEFFLSLGIPILEVYGMTECTGPATLSSRSRYRSGFAGWCIPGAELKIADDGEICMRGPHVFLGYYKNPEATAETLDAQGWLHSGDIGELDDNGFLRITDRKKELIITSGGKNIAPQILEGKLRAIPAVGGAVVVGDRRNYLTALLTLDPERLLSIARTLGSPAKDLAQAAVCPKFRTHLESEVARVNESLARFESIKRFTLLPEQFSIDGGELTPNLKLKRRVIYEKYASEIDELYAKAP